ncbi:tripartite tricarboxylate transporter TctB family protein [Paeniglutamicibacter sp. ABSL32-1]|uniref:tripartite tricarboxylate transporter TctB family protein n=1 Tax=Paeniglutamicibacter quisquiliarum TaxID=2849498 RepID=UPI001C2DB338|nr:tripartite tricarboxylate transporter TctB family protein [Paeniglutamicibacter quisquiliarum]
MKTIEDSPATGRKTEDYPVRITGFWSGRSELIVPALVFTLAGFLSYGTATMEVMGTSVPGPQFFPTIVCVLLFLMAAIHTIQILRTRRFPHADSEGHNPDFSSDMLGDLGDTEGKSIYRPTAPPSATGKRKAYSDWKTLGTVIGGVAAFIVALPVLGWILSAAGLFWVVCRALGSKRPLFDISISILFSAVIQLAFNAGLGLNLPSGFLEGLI